MVIDKMANWLHRLFNPHCPECRELDEELRNCKSCDTLKEQIHLINQTNKELMDHLFPSNDEPVETNVPEFIKPRTIPWKVKQQMLESEDRQKAILLRKSEIENLEEELGIPNPGA